MKHLSIWLVGVVFLTALILVFGGVARPTPKPLFGARLQDLVPSNGEIAGWERRDEAIAATPEMQRVVREILNFDEGVYVSYWKGGERVSVYLAYWRPGTMAQRPVAGHTPDVCWVGAGWEPLRRERWTHLQSRSGQLVPPAEFRSMRASEVREQVLFWHLAGGKVRLSPGAGPPWYAMFTDTFADGLNQRPEQFFLRISSTRPDAGWGTEVVGALVEKLTAAGVFGAVNPDPAQARSVEPARE
jgi:hypothetical protein